MQKTPSIRCKLSVEELLTILGALSISLYSSEDTKGRNQFSKVLMRINDIMPKLEIPGEDVIGSESMVLYDKKLNELYWLANQGDGTYIIYDPDDIDLEGTRDSENDDPEPLYCWDNYADLIEWWNNLNKII